MKKIYVIICLLQLCIAYSFGQKNSTAYFYTSAIDTVYELIKDANLSDTILARQHSFYKKAIHKYTGNHKVFQINNLNDNDSLVLKRLFLLVYPSPIYIVKGEVVILLSTHTISYRRKRKYTTGPFKEKAYYVFFKPNSIDNTYSISKIGFGPACYDINP